MRAISRGAAVLSVTTDARRNLDAWLKTLRRRSRSERDCALRLTLRVGSSGDLKLGFELDRPREDDWLYSHGSRIVLLVGAKCGRWLNELTLDLVPSGPGSTSVAITAG
jgi:hypothetical protein